MKCPSKGRRGRSRTRGLAVATLERSDEVGVHPLAERLLVVRSSRGVTRPDGRSRRRRGRRPSRRGRGRSRPTSWRRSSCAAWGPRSRPRRGSRRSGRRATWRRASSPCAASWAGACRWAAGARVEAERLEVCRRSRWGRGLHRPGLKLSSPNVAGAAGARSAARGRSACGRGRTGSAGDARTGRRGTTARCRKDETREEHEAEGGPG